MMARAILKVSFTGDLMCLKEQNAAIIEAARVGVENAYNEIFKYIKPIFEDTDLLIGNLETPVSGAPLSSEAIRFNTPVEYVKACKNCGFDFVSTANNHCLDQGIDGLMETIRNLDEEGILHSGTYKTFADSERICLLNKRGVSIAIVCATFGTNSEFNGVILPKEETWRVDLLKRQNKPARVRFNPDSASGRKMIADNVTSAAITNSANSPYIDRYLQKIEKAREMADMVFVLPHTGGQYNPYPGNYTRHIVDVTAEKKPSYIVCSHPHVPQYFARVKGVPAAFSLGNFSFTPDTGYYIPNSLAEYGLVLHTYWNSISKELLKSTFSIVKNVVGEDGISRVMPVDALLSALSSPVDKERLRVEVQAVANRAASTYVANPFESEIELGQVPEHK